MTTQATEPVRDLRRAVTPGHQRHESISAHCLAWDAPATLSEQRRSAPSALAVVGNHLARALSASLRWRPRLQDGAEILLLALALPLYYLVRGQAQERASEAIRRGADIVTLEKSLGIFWEADLQKAALEYGWFVDALNAFYLYGHLPLIGALAVWLYFGHRPQYLLMRNAFLISGAIALVVYLNFPTAPPRLLPERFGFEDTLFQQYGHERPLTPTFFVNQYAAMPSMHFGWNMLVGLAIWLSTRNAFVRALAVAMPIAMFTTIVLTANHYILDPVLAIPIVAAGLAIALGGRWLALRLLSPESNAAKEGGWANWVYWLVGIDETTLRTRRHMRQPASWPT
jgi:PAP2 superfamily protein